MKKMLILFIMLLVAFPLLATDYYVKNGGNDGLDGESDGNAWETIAKVNGESFSPGDTIYFKKGSTWRDELLIPSSGSDGSPITIDAYGTGDDPIIMGSEDLTGWEIDAGNIWEATEATTVGGVYFIETDDSISWGILKASKGACVAEYDWYWDDGLDMLYVYAATDPDTRYNAVEVAIEYSCIKFDEAYVTIKNLEVCFSKYHGIVGQNYSSTSHQIIEYNTVHHIGAFTGAWWEGNGITTSSSHSRVRHNLVYEIGRRGLFRHVIPENTEDIIFEYNEVRNCYYTFTDAQNGGGYDDVGTIVRYNKLYCDDDFMSALGTPSGVYAQDPKVSFYVYYNLIYNIPGSYVIAIHSSATGGNIYIYNNVIYGCPGGGISVGGTVAATVRNNIVWCDNLEANQKLLNFDDVTNKTSDYNCLHVAVGDFLVKATNNYESFAAYQAGVAGIGWAANSIDSDPTFVNAGGSYLLDTDFLIPTGSPCKDDGVDVGLSLDYWSNMVWSGTAPDIGAHEFQQGDIPTILIRDILLIRDEVIIR